MIKHQADQINVGDEITYKDKYVKPGTSNWKVVGKLDKSILFIERNENGVIDKRMIDVSEIETIVGKE
jgi:hypothetical protein